jgi:hypothetical protein
MYFAVQLPNVSVKKYLLSKNTGSIGQDIEANMMLIYDQVAAGRSFRDVGPNRGGRFAVNAALKVDEQMFVLIYTCQSWAQQHNSIND